MVGYVEIIVELACEAGGGGGDAIGVESSLVGFASTPEKGILKTTAKSESKSENAKVKVRTLKLRAAWWALLRCLKSVIMLKTKAKGIKITAAWWTLL